MSSSSRARLTFWLTPTLSVLMGAAYFVAAWISGHHWLAVSLLALMLAVTAGVLVASRHSEIVRGLLNRRDERIVGIDQRATAAAGTTLIVAVLIGALVELVRGHSGAPFTWLGAIAGLAYLVAVAVGRSRG